MASLKSNAATTIRNGQVRCRAIRSSSGPCGWTNFTTNRVKNTAAAKQSPANRIGTTICHASTTPTGASNAGTVSATACRVEKKLENGVGSEAGPGGTVWTA